MTLVVALVSVALESSGLPAPHKAFGQGIG